LREETSGLFRFCDGWDVGQATLLFLVPKICGVQAIDPISARCDWRLSTGRSSATRDRWSEPNNDAHQCTCDEYFHNDKDKLESKAHDALYN